MDIPSGRTRPRLRASAPGFVLLALLCLPPILASGATCDHAVTCETGGDLEFSIDCETNSVIALPCDVVQQSVPNALLRVAVRCYGSTDGKEAKLTSKHGWSGGFFQFDDLAESCTSGYIASAHWIRFLPGGSQEVYQAQCSTGTVPDCVPMQSDEADDLARRFTLYSLVNPASNSCGGGPDTSQVEVRSASLTRGYEGVLAGNYMCVRDPLAADWAWCDEPNQRPASRTAASKREPPGSASDRRVRRILR